MIDAVADLGGFGNNRMQIDFSIHVVHAPPGSPTRTTVSHPWGYYDPDCEPLGMEIAVPTWSRHSVEIVSTWWSTWLPVRPGPPCSKCSGVIQSGLFYTFRFFRRIFQEAEYY